MLLDHGIESGRLSTVLINMFSSRHAKERVSYFIFRYKICQYESF